MIASFQKKNSGYFPKKTKSVLLSSCRMNRLWYGRTREKMSIVIRNIISQRIQIPHSGGSIYITTGLTDDGKRCYVRVEDNGVGIPQNKLTEIFERFSQKENAQKLLLSGHRYRIGTFKRDRQSASWTDSCRKSRRTRERCLSVELLMDKRALPPVGSRLLCGRYRDSPCFGRTRSCCKCHIRRRYGRRTGNRRFITDPSVGGR